MINAPEKKGYKFIGWVCDNKTYDEGEVVAVTEDMEFEAQWYYIISGTDANSVNVEESANGSIEVNPKRASSGTTITITVKPDSEYELGSLIVTNENGRSVALEQVSENEYTFEMPEGGAWVEASFVKSAYELPFKDVAIGDWFYEAVKYVYDNGLMNGMSADTFGPNTNLSRGMIVKVLYNLEGGKDTAGSESVFSDVSSDAWYAAAVNWAAANGIVEGYENGEFRPEQDLTRAEMAVILYRYAEYKGYDMSASGSLSAFADSSEVPAWAEAGMSWAVGIGVINGVGNNMLNPTGTAQRAEVAQLLMNYCELIVK